MDIVDLHHRACEGFAAAVASVGPDQWHLPTPCSEWDVRALVDHVVAEDLWTPPLLAGETIEQIGDRFDGDMLGSDPVGACQQATNEATAAVAETGALERTVHLSFGEATGELYVWQLFTDHLIHTWDLASGIGADAQLDPELVQACAAWFADQEPAYREAGIIGPRVLGGDGDQQSELLAAFGRNPRAWSQPARSN